jgi:quinol monooxygenase YgiN
MDTVRVFARLKSKPGNESLVREGMTLLVDASRQEKGVSLYELYETEDGGEFLVNEEYTDEAAFESHLASDHLKNAVARITPLLLGGLEHWKTRQIR